MPHLYAGFFVCTLVHLASIAVSARLAGVSIRTFSLGFGPRLLELGRFRLGAILTGGYVRFLDSREEEASPRQIHAAFDSKSTPVQLFVMLSGCMVLAGASIGIEGRPALQALADAPLQLLAGAISPLDAAQDLLHRISAYSQSTSFTSLLAMVAAKMAAINLLPFPACNGGAAVGAIARALGVHKFWPSTATRALLLSLAGLLGSWLVAVLAYPTKA